jgi:hypothetical protein
MSPADTELLGETMSTVVVEGMTAAFKFIVAMATIKKAIKSLKAGGKTNISSLWIVCERTERCKKGEGISLFFVA